MINNIGIIMGKVDSTVSDVCIPRDGMAYAHHPSIIWYRGKFWAVWSSGMSNEDDFGQNVCIAESVDGKQWENVRHLITPEMLGDEEYILTAAGFLSHGDMLNVYYGYYKYTRPPMVDNYKELCSEATHVITGLGVICTTDGEKWSGPEDLGVPIVPNHGPQATSTGRLIISGNMMFPYTDDEKGLEKYQLSGIYGDTFGDGLPYDDEFGHKFVSSLRGRKASDSICEGSFFETPDRVLHMMLRAGEGVLWCSESRDDGVSWSEPKPTAYADCGSKFHFGKLPDGRFYGVSNPIPGSKRTPLSICISRDGENFDRQYIIRDEVYECQYDGLHKGGIYGYPHTLIHEGNMYIIYSKCKEVIEVTKIAIEQLK